MHRRLLAPLLAALALALAFAPAQDAPSQPAGGVFAKPGKPDESDEFFGHGAIPRLELEIAEGELEKLRSEPRNYVHAKLREDRRTLYADVAVKLKGAAGSFRELDDLPAFTINVDKYEKKLAFHGLDKFHLNNSVQDDTWLHEWLGSQLMNAAGVPAPRFTQARVWLNGRDLGVYTLKEGFDAKFVARHFEHVGGNLYDGGFCLEVDGGLEKDAGKGPDDGRDLRALAEACREPDPALRFKRIAERLDVDAFLSFVAMELCVGHWDGYALNTNNYRVYVEPSTGRAYFLPSGMDQIFGDAEAPVLDYPNALVAEAVMRNPEWRARFRKRLAELLPLFDVKDELLPRIKAAQKRLEPALKQMGSGAAAEWAERVQGLVARLEAREKSLREQVKRPEPKSLEFDSKGVGRLSGFALRVDAGDAAGEQVTTGTKRAYRLECGKEPCEASWRKKVVLPKGRYAFEASCKLDAVAPLADDPASGAQLRLSDGPRGNGALGDAGWSKLRCEFEVLEETRLIELVAELRAARGKAWFELASLRVVKRP